MGHEGITEKTRYTTKTPNEQKHQSAYAIHLRAMQPTITSWINKQATVSIARQTDPSRQIHLLTQTRMQNIQKQWRDTWQKERQQQTKTTKNTQPPLDIPPQKQTHAKTNRIYTSK